MRRQEFATKTGFSSVTVSRALNNDRRVSHETRRSIQLMARELGYRPHAAARSLARRVNENVGLILASGGQTTCSSLLRTYSDLIPKLSSLLESAGRNLMLATLDERAVTPEYLDNGQLPKMIEESHIDAAVVLSSSWPELETLLKKMRLFAVIVDGQSFGLPAVQRDEIAAAEKMVDHLVELAHRRIAYWGPVQPSDPPPYRGALWPRGYCQAMTRHSLLPIAGWEKPMALDQGIEHYLALPAPPTAIIAYDDVMAAHVIHRLSQRGVRVPQDLSVVALRDNGHAAAFISEITRVAIPFDAMAQQAVEWLVELESRPQTPESRAVQFPGVLVPGQSAAAAPQG